MKIFRLLTAFVLTAFIITAAYGQTDSEKPKSKKTVTITAIGNSNARLEFDHTTYNFGSIAKGSVVTHNFWFENTGTDTLVITRIKPTCGCTSTRKAGFSVAPGEKTSIDIVFDSGKFNGRITKAIKVECNDPVNPFLDLRFKATINNPLQILEYSPLQVNFENVPEGKNSKVIINITNIDSTESQILIIEKPSSDFIETELKKDSLKPDNTTEIEFVLLRNLEKGEFLTSISLEAKDKPGSRITIPINGNVVE